MSNDSLQLDLEARCRRIIDKQGWTQFRDLEVVLMPDMSQFGAHITLDEWKIRLITGEDYYEAAETLLKQEKLPISPEHLTEQVLYSVIGHEHGHFIHAPKTQENLHRILKGIYEAIHEREAKKSRLNEWCFYIHNMFTDTILNTVNAHADRDPQRYREGLALTYLLMNNYTRRKLGPLHGKADKAHTLFLMSNHTLCALDPEFTARNGKYLTRWFPGFKRYREKLLDVFTGDRLLTRKAVARELDEPENEQILKRMQDTSLWEKMSYDYAHIIYPFIRRQLSWIQSSQTRRSPPQSQPQSRPQPGESGDKKNEKEDSRGAGYSQIKKGNKTKKGNETETVEDKLYRKADEYMQRLLSDANKEPYSSPFLQQFWRLDTLYRQRAGRIALFAEEPHRLSPHYELSAGREEMPLHEFSSRDIDWPSTRLIRRENGVREAHLYRKAMPISFPMQVEEKPGGIPDISWIFDSSSSMDFEPFQGEGKGEYHFAALAKYSMLRWLEEIGLAPILNYHVINFSARTTSSGWCSYEEIIQAKRTLFDYQGSGTILDPGAIREMRTTRRDNAISFMLTDTDFNFSENEEAIIKEIDLLLAGGGVGLYLFHLGGKETTFSRAMEERGVPVHQVETAKDFMEAGIKFTKDLYGGIANELRV